jgi:hypothetical protein
MTITASVVPAASTGAAGSAANSATAAQAARVTTRLACLGGFRHGQGLTVPEFAFIVV